METLLQQILNLLITPPGNLIYHLVLAFAVLSSLQAALIARRSNPSPLMNRMVLGLGMLLAGQAILFFSSGLAWQGILDERIFLPPLDRAIVLLSIVWIIWLWNFPGKARLGDIVTGFLNLGVIILFLFTYTSWSSAITSPQAGAAGFNNTWMDWTWELSALFVVLTGMAVLLFSRPTGWGFGIGMLSLSLAGIIAHLVIGPVTGDLSGYLRLGQLAAFPLLPTLLNRVGGQPAQVAELASAPPAPAAQPRTQERRRYSASPRAVHAWLELVREDEPEKVLTGMAKAVAHTMLSDLCYIVGKPAYGHVVLQSGFDLIREETTQGTMLDQSQLPALYNAIQRGKPLRLTTSDSQPVDLKALAIALGLTETGSIMFLPLGIGDKPLGGILLLSPYSNRQWSVEDQSYLASEIEGIAKILQHASSEGEEQQKEKELMGSLRSEVETLRVENQNLLLEISELRETSRTAAQQATAAELAASHKTTAQLPALPQKDLRALVALQEETQAQIANLQAENERLQSALRERGISVLSPDEFSRLESELRSTLQELAQLQNQLAGANARNLILERQAQQGGVSSEEREIITSTAQEIRQPLSSIFGYSDLLLSESVGILGAMQRKFLERVKASTERMRSMLDDLIRLTATGEGKLDLLPKPFELSAVIDGAVVDTSAQMREKDIALLVDLPEQMPQIYADQDAIQQVVIHLLQNAGAVTPPEGTITLRARLQEDSDNNYLLMQVTDSGGGIQPADLPRVFARRYRADKPLIQGLGDTGVGLSIAKTLVEAHGGRIWVDSGNGQTTMSALLPVQMETTSTKVG